MRITWPAAMLPALVLCGQLLAVAPFFDPATPVHGTPVDAGEAGKVSRGLMIQAGKEEWVVFDQDLLRPALWFHSSSPEPVSPALMAQASWENPTRKGGVKLPVPAESGVPLAPPLPGVGNVMADLMQDPRPVFGDDPGRGGLEASGRRYLGHYLAGGTGVLAYRCGEVTVREWYEADRNGLLRHLSAGPGNELVFRVASGDFQIAGDRQASSGSLQVASNHPGLKLESHEGKLIARLAASARERGASLSYGERRSISAGKTPAVPSAYPPRWTTALESRIEEAVRSGPGWVQDRVGLPEDNPSGRRVRPADIVFLSPERAAVVTFEGDVWRLDLSDGRCRWTRIAAGLCEPLSIEQVDGQLQVFTRNGIIRLRDLNGDGETDYYENHSSLILQTAGTRGYPLDMEVDETGRTWVSVGGIVTDDRTITNKAPANPHSGSIVMISADGSELEVTARGAREPFFARDPATGRIAMSDQQGNWVPSSGILPVVPGADFGFGRADASMQAPVVWIPHDQNNSSSSPLWLRDTAFADWNGGLLDLSYGSGRILLVRPGEGWPVKEGAVIPLAIDTGLPILHARIHPGDGSIWFAGFRIYDSRAPELQGIARLRPSGEPLEAAVDARVVKEGVVLRFAAPLDRSSLRPEAVLAKEWQYRRGGGYGSPRFKRDGQQGADALATGGVFLSKDAKSVFVHIPELEPTMQLEVSHRFHIAGASPGLRPVFFTVTDPPAARWDELGFDRPDLDHAVAAVREDDAGVGKPSVEQGKELSARYGCIACHSVDGTTEGHSGPSWKGLFGSERRFIQGAPRNADEAYLIESILEPDKVIVEGYAVGMGSYAGVLSDSEIESIVLYIRSLQ